LFHDSSFCGMRRGSDDNTTLLYRIDGMLLPIFIVFPLLNQSIRSTDLLTIRNSANLLGVSHKSVDGLLVKKRLLIGRVVNLVLRLLAGVKSPMVIIMR
jgi:hypothetical protein